MKHYLDLIPISAKVHKRSNRMTILCIIMSVLLVTAIFSITDMALRATTAYMLKKHGNWHIKLENISLDIAEELKNSPDVTAVGLSDSFNDDVDQPYYMNEKKTTLYGTDSVYMTQLSNGMEEGTFPQNDNEIILSSNAKLALQIQLGDQITLHTPAGDTDFTISGFGSDDTEYYEGQTYLVGAYMTRTAFAAVMAQNNQQEHPVCYVQFQNAAKAADAMSKLPKMYDLPDDSISENTAVMGLAGKSSNAKVTSFYAIAAALFVMVLLAGTLMISGSMNSNVAQRTKFFGMMRCIGASRRQIIRFVRLEALNWCKTAVPAGLLSGIIISCCICAFLHYKIGGEFADIPVIAVSPIGLVCGTVVGIVTVLLAAQSPAKHAAKVSPICAVSGNLEAAPSVRHKINIPFIRTEWILGIHHATASKKNWFLMTASFALSIILSLCFSIGLDFARGLIPSLTQWNPDLTLGSFANELILDESLFNQIQAIPGIEHAYFSAYKQNIKATSSREGVDHINLISYSSYLMDTAQDSVAIGDLSDLYGDSGKVMTIQNKDNPFKVGDTIQIAGSEVEIVCAVSTGLYPSEFSVICSPQTFARLTGEENFNLIGIQLSKHAGEETIQQISRLAADNVIFTDMRKRNQEDYTTYLATQLIGYGFLAVIAAISIFYIINSISMSVTARIKQYGAMRAIGMDGRQLTQMIAAEAYTYVISGLAAGCILGLPFSRFLHIQLLTHYFGTAWHLPAALLGIIFLIALVSAAAAVYAPARRICHMAVTETINEL